MLKFLHVLPGNEDDPGDGSLQNTTAPSDPVYCSNRILVGSSSILNVCA